MSVEAPVQNGCLIRYGHQAGDLLKLLIVTGERMIRTPAQGEPEVQEVEREFHIAQAITRLEEARMVVQNRVRSVFFRRNDQRWEVPGEGEEKRIEMLRSGAAEGVEAGAPLAPFVFPAHPVAVGDSWDAEAELNLKHCQGVKVTLRCTRVEFEQPGMVAVDMQSEELTVDGVVARVTGRMEFSVEHGCLTMGVLGNTQRGQDGSDKMEWRQWLFMALTDRIGVEEFADEQ